MKLNLGCGLDKREDHTNIDCREEVKPDLVIDLENEKLSRFDDNSVEHITCKDFLEHLNWHTVEDFLKDCHRVMKNGATIYIQTPDMEAIAHKVILNPTMKEDYRAISYWVYGSGDYGTPSLHKAGFTIPALKKLLENTGFQVLEIKNDGGTNIICMAKKP